MTWDKEERHFNFNFIDEDCSCDEHCPIEEEPYSTKEQLFGCFIALGVPTILNGILWAAVYFLGGFSK